MNINSIRNKLKESKRMIIFNRIPVTVIGTISPNIDLNKILRQIERTLISKKFFYNIEEIYFGNFNFLKGRQIQSLYSDGCIYVSGFNNDQDITETIIIKDIIHEIGHSLETDYGMDIYGDGELELEFYAKKKKLLFTLKNSGYNFPGKEFLSNSEYSIELDKFLYRDVGYTILGPMIVGLFTSPYSATSLSEYYANGFEYFYTIGDRKYLQQICPILFNKIKELDKIIKMN